MNANTTRIALLVGLTFSLSACFNSDDDDMPMVNSVPVANSAMLTTQADTPIMDSVTATDADMDTLSYSVDTEPMNGTLTLGSDGQFTYEPAYTFTGTDSFVFSVSDGMATAMATVDITIEAQQVSFSSYSRTVFGQQESDMPLPTNGREFIQDVTDPAAYDDILMNPEM